jgi:succinate dehydrogenase/fumarate reductase cytochrome b subunit
MEYILICIFWAVVIWLLYGAYLYVMDRQHEFEIRKSKEVHKMIQDINKFADSKINETNGYHKAVKVAFQLTILSALMFFIGAEISLYLN